MATIIILIRPYSLIIIFLKMRLHFSFLEIHPVNLNPSVYFNSINVCRLCTSHVLLINHGLLIPAPFPSQSCFIHYCTNAAFSMVHCGREQLGGSLASRLVFFVIHYQPEMSQLHVLFHSCCLRCLRNKPPTRFLLGFTAFGQN